MDTEKQKTAKEEQAEYFKKKRRLVLTYRTIQAVIFIAAVVFLFLNWRLAVVTAGWAIWNDAVYTSGCQKRVVDEYETGYPEDGLRSMFKSWIAYAIITAIGLFVMYTLIPN